MPLHRKVAPRESGKRIVASRVIVSKNCDVLPGWRKILFAGKYIVPSLLKKSDFKRVADIAKTNWGLNLTEKKIELVDNRLRSFLRKSTFNSVGEYLDHIENEADDEDRLVFFDILSTNVTSFFREKDHFDYLEREFYTPLNRGNLTLPGKRIRCWSAACSTGPEPFSMAIQALELMENLSSWDFKILATDLSNTAVEQARKAVYPKKMLEKMDASMRSKYFKKVSGEPQNLYQVAPEVRKLVTIARQNLMDSWSFKGLFDVIFCRNVMIYFDQQTRQELVLKFYEQLRPGGILAIGSAETLAGLQTPFKSIRASLYTK